MIETAFEMGLGATYSDQESAHFCRIGDKCDKDGECIGIYIDDPGTRMRLIMENIVVNRGYFNPDKKPVPVYTTPGFKE